MAAGCQSVGVASAAGAVTELTMVSRPPRPQSRLLASAAPSASAANLAQTTVG